MTRDEALNEFLLVDNSKIDNEKLSVFKRFEAFGA